MLDPPGEGEDIATEDGRRPLIEDIEDLVLDAKTYFDAEVSYQKSRIRFAGLSFANTIVYAIIGAVLGLVALIALSVGIILSLSPLIGPFGATAIVTAALLLAVAFALRRAKNSWADLMETLEERKDSEE